MWLAEPAENKLCDPLPEKDGLPADGLIQEELNEAVHTELNTCSFVCFPGVTTHCG
jgi:hypothetical protein